MGPGEPAVSLHGIQKDYKGLRPLRIARLELRLGESVALLGLDRAAAESLVNLITGATLPDAGRVDVFGTSTDAIRDPDTWLRTLDDFGILSERAVLLDQFTVEQNLALPLSLELDEMSPAIRAQAQRLAGEVGIAAGDLTRAVAALGPLAQMRVRLGKALALGPRVVLAEHPNAMLAAGDLPGFASDFAAVAARRGVAALVLTADRTFARAVARRVLTLNAATGDVTPVAGWRRWLPS